MEKLYLELRDHEWPESRIDHDRQIARAVVYDDDGNLYFVRAVRSDDFGPATLIETSGGGIEPGETPADAIRRELKEELGVEAEITRELGVVSDYYNLIHRHNVNHYFLCRAVSFGHKALTRDERETFHLSTMKLTAEEALGEYRRHAVTPLGRLICQRELPILQAAIQDPLYRERLGACRKSRRASVFPVSLSDRYHVRSLNDDDADAILSLSRTNPLFFEYNAGPVTRESVLEDLRILPPGKTALEKHYLGFFLKSSLVAVLDLIEDYPTPGCAYVGLFMVDAAFQGRGIGSGIVSELAQNLPRFGFSEAQLAINKGNAQAEHFWSKNGFAVFEEASREDGILLKARRTFREEETEASTV